MRGALLAGLVVGGLLVTPSSGADTAPGLLVRLYDIGVDVAWLPELVPDQLPNVVKVVPTLDLHLEQKGFGEFEARFMTEVTGQLKVEKVGTYRFRLIGDDGAKLWLNNKLVIDHDGLHGAEPKDSAPIELSAGAHDLRILHFQGGGGTDLRLEWQAPGAKADAFELVPAAVLSHPADASMQTAPGRKKIIPPLRRGRPGDGTPVAGLPASLAARHDIRLVRASSVTGPDGPIPMLTVADDIGEIRFLRPEARGLYIWSGLTPTPSTRTWVMLPPGERSLTNLVADDHGLVLGDSGSRELFRLTPDTIGNVRQWCVFRLAGGLENPFDGLYVLDRGGWILLANGGTPQFMLVPTHAVQFSMAGVRAVRNGLEIAFSKPLDPRVGWDPESYYVEQWPFDVEKGVSPHRDGIVYAVKSASVSVGRMWVFLEIPDLKPSHVVYLRLLPPCVSEDGELPWSTEAWYTLNVIPQDRVGEVLPPPAKEPQNVLTAEEQQQGFRLLFDGQTTKGWHGYGKNHSPPQGERPGKGAGDAATPTPTLPLKGGGGADAPGQPNAFPDGWKVVDGSLVRVGPAGDIVTDEEFGDFELRIDWRISPGGNSGIMYRVAENLGGAPETGPEYQILDNAEHGDGRNPKTSAASCYALYAPVRDVTVPVGLFNRARIIARGNHVEHWLNDIKVVEYELGSPEWRKLVGDSKFGSMPNFGRQPRGRIDLQDHGDKVWYRNIRIRPLTEGSAAAPSAP